MRHVDKRNAGGSSLPQVEYTLSLPYTGSLQPSALRYPVRITYDGPGARMHMSVFHGLDEVLTVGDVTYNLYPRISTASCLTVGGGSGPTYWSQQGEEDARRVGKKHHSGDPAIPSVRAATANCL